MRRRLRGDGPEQGRVLDNIRRFSDLSPAAWCEEERQRAEKQRKEEAAERQRAEKQRKEEQRRRDAEDQAARQAKQLQENALYEANKVPYEHEI